MRRVFQAPIHGLLAAMLWGGNLAAQDRKPLLVAEPGHNIGYLPLYLAIRKGFFAEEGLDVKMLTMESGSAHTNAVLSGQAFAFIGGPEHDAFAKLKGAELRAVVNVVNRGNVYYLAARGREPVAGEDMASYFRGKVVATSAFGGTPNSITRYLFKKWNLKDGADLTLREMLTSAVPLAIKTGNAQIATAGEPFIMQGIRQGFWGEPFLNIPRELGPYAYSTLNVRFESIQKDPETVRKFVRGVIRGLGLTRAEPAEAAASAKAEFPTMPQEDLKATIDRYFADNMWSEDGSITRASWETAKSVVLVAGILKQDVPYDQIIDTRYVEPAAAKP